ncbi:MAG: hypothetical protein JWN11_1213 [Hyphomicrobiales bacterium]|nr:hypothetical protein [Hyphomicrobiales bacterium]
MSIVRTTVTVIGVAVAISRHPLVRAGMKAAPHLMSPRMRETAAESARVAAFNAGALLRRIVPKSML